MVNMSWTRCTLVLNKKVSTKWQLLSCEKEIGWLIVTIKKNTYPHISDALNDEIYIMLSVPQSLMIVY